MAPIQQLQKVNEPETLAAVVDGAGQTTPAYPTE
jgi:hypothetical protein